PCARGSQSTRRQLLSKRRPALLALERRGIVCALNHLSHRDTETQSKSKRDGDLHLALAMLCVSVAVPLLRGQSGHSDHCVREFDALHHAVGTEDSTVGGHQPAIKGNLDVAAQV